MPTKLGKHALSRYETVMIFHAICKKFELRKLKKSQGHKYMALHTELQF